ncbi:MAG: hypothetical protein JOZ89_05950, partial [Gammaproteobacteria bacterium]|nr:hypothetical protein [Gammaproteobacteria bacterium]
MSPPVDSSRNPSALAPLLAFAALALLASGLSYLLIQTRQGPEPRPVPVGSLYSLAL